MVSFLPQWVQEALAHIQWLVADVCITAEHFHVEDVCQVAFAQFIELKTPLVGFVLHINFKTRAIFEVPRQCKCFSLAHTLPESDPPSL